MSLITIHFDGGCRPTNPGNKYGSYEIKLDGLLFDRKTFELGHGTNNEAEFESLEKALVYVICHNIWEELHPHNYSVEIFTDSTILRNRIAGKNRSKKSEPQQRMFALAERCLALLACFKSFKIHWQPRQHNVERFGH